MTGIGRDTLGARRTLRVDGAEYDWFSLPEAGRRIGDVSRLPVSLKALLENVLRFEDGTQGTVEDARAFVAWLRDGRARREVPFRPARILTHDASGIPAVVDLAAMRDGMIRLGGDPARVNPSIPVDLVIDHSVMVDHWASPDALQRNMAIEIARNAERYALLRWAQGAFSNLRVVPPGKGICHQVNLEHLAQTVWTERMDGRMLAYPDTVFGLDSHTPMVNALGVLGWGVGGIEAEAAMLGRATAILLPEVVGVRLTGRLPEGATATDLVLTLTERLRRRDVVGKFVEFTGPGLDALSLPDRATLANMAPEYGATVGFFPIDAVTLAYLRLTGRDPHRIALVEHYARAQGMWRDAGTPEPRFTETVAFDLDDMRPSLAGPRRPQDRVDLAGAAAAFRASLAHSRGGDASPRQAALPERDATLADGSVIVAAITSCTNTSNPSVMIAAGLLARKARARGLRPKPWVKTSLTPGSRVVAAYLEASGLQDDLNALGFALAGFGCATCPGNSGPLDADIVSAVEQGRIAAVAVLSGNRNFEGRVHPNAEANYLASPPLVVAYALLGTMQADITTEPLGYDPDGAPVMLRDIWPSDAEIRAVMEATLHRGLFESRYADLMQGSAAWQDLPVQTGSLGFAWDSGSTYVKRPPFFDGITAEPPPVRDISGARILAVLGDSITTDHISPGGVIRPSSPAGEYLGGFQVRPADFNSYLARRGNHEVMMRGTFAHPRLRNALAPEAPGGSARHVPSGTVMPIYDAAMRYAEDGVPLVVFGGREYGTGSSRDWAAKGTALLGVKAVIAESFERIHRSNLVGMGVLPLVRPAGELMLHGDETVCIEGLEALTPRGTLTVTLHRPGSDPRRIPVTCRIDTADELAFWQHGGVLQYLLRSMQSAPS